MTAALRTRRRLYAAAAVVAALGVFVDRRPGLLGVGLLALGGIAIGWIPFSSRRARIAGFFAFEQAMGVLVALVGYPLVGLAVVLGSTAGTALMTPLRRWAPWVGSVASGVVALTDLPAGGSSTAFRVVTAAALVGGIGLLFGAVGEEVEADHRRLKEWPLRQRRLMDAASEPMVVHRHGSVVYCNPAAARLVEVDSPDELMGRRVLDFVHPADKPLAASRMAKVEAGEPLEPARIRIVTARGAIRHVETNAYRTDWEGELAVQLMIRDHTELEATRAEIEELFHRLPVALYRSTPAGEVIAGNPALAELLGYPNLEDLLGNTEAANLAYPDIARRRFWRNLMERYGKVLGFEQQIVRRDGGRLWVSDSAITVRDEKGEVLYYEGALVDITDRVKAEEWRRRLMQIVETTSEMIGVCDRNGVLRYANPALRRFLQGDPAEPLRPVHIGRLVDASASRLVTGALLESGRWEGELEVGVGATRRLVSVTILRHGDDDDAFLSVVARDLTEARLTARRLERLVKAKDEFVAAVSHELRTPLTAVVGMAAELRQRHDAFTDEERRELVSLVAEQAQEVAYIVDDLLVAARADTDSIVLVETEVDLKEAVETVLRGLPSNGGTRVANLAAGTVRGDAARVRQILRNLVVNALRYGGPTVVVRTHREGDYVHLEVADDGEGVPEELRERIFQPFERAHRPETQPSSVGLGLTVSRWLARRMGGDLTYRHDHESVFTLSLPAA